MAAVEVESTFLVEGVTRQQVWDYLEDVDNAGEWNTFVRSAEALDPPGEGRRIRSHVGFLGITFAVEATTTTAEPPRRSIVTGAKPFSSRIGMTLEEAEGGVAMTAMFSMSPGKFFPVPGMVLRRAVQRQFDKDTALLKRNLEELAAT